MITVTTKKAPEKKRRPCCEMCGKKLDPTYRHTAIQRTIPLSEAARKWAREHFEKRHRRSPDDWSVKECIYLDPKEDFREVAEIDLKHLQDYGRTCVVNNGCVYIAVYWKRVFSGYYGYAGCGKFCSRSCGFDFATRTLEARERKSRTRKRPSRNG